MIKFINNYPIQLPSWLNEIIINGQPEKINLDDFLSWRKKINQPIIIAVEGLPGAGKTGLMNELKNVAGIKTINQFEIEIDSLKNNGHLQYLKNDIYKSLLANQRTEGIVVMDRDFSSTLAFAYAKSSLDNTNDYDLINEYYKKLIGAELKTADIYIYLSVDPKVSISRKQSESRDPLWNNIQFLQHMQEFYDNYFDYMKFIAPVIRIDTMQFDQTCIIDKVLTLINNVKNGS